MAAVRKAQEIYLDWMIAERAGNLPKLPGGPAPVLFKTAYESFLKRAEHPGVQKVTPAQIQNYRDKWTMLQSDEYVIDGCGLGTMALTDVTEAWLESLRAKRKESTHIVDALGRTRVRKKPVSNNTLSKDFDFIRLVLKHAVQRDKTLEKLPVFPEFEGRFWAVEDNPRPAFPPGMWSRLKRKLLAFASAPDLNPRTRRQRQELYAYALMCVGAALNPSEALSLCWKDCRLGHLGKMECVHLWAHGKHAKHADTNKRRRGWALFDGVTGFKYLQKVYPHAKPNDPLFTEDHGGLFVECLEAWDYYVDAQSGSLRNELLARDDARKESIDGILGHLKTLNGRTRKSETAITRLNLIVFGVGGPVSLAVLGVVLKLWLKV